MTNAIIDAVSISLAAEFGESYTIYTEEVKQGLTEPCFFLSCANRTHRLFRGLAGSTQRYFQENLFCIQYFPVSDDRKNEECNAVASRLNECLEWLDVDGDLVMGTQMHCEIADGILNFFVNYDLFVRKERQTDAVEEYTQSQTVKE